MSLLGIDVGSSHVKGVAFNHQGQIIAEADGRYTVTSSGPGRLEMVPEQMWAAVAQTVRGIGEQTAEHPVEAMTIASHGETFVAVDADGRALGPAIMNADNRAVAESAEIEQRLGRDRIYNISGAPPHPMFASAKIAWLKKHQPDVLRKARRFLCVGDYVCSRMGLPPVTDFSLASRTQLLDMHTRQWSDELCADIDLDPALLPSVRQAGTVMGELSAKQAGKLGLPKGVFVVAGGHDQPVGALGLGVVHEGVVGDSAGTYECLTLSSSSPHVEPDARAASLNSYCHVVPDQYITLAFFPSGVMVRWFMETLCGVTDDAEAAQLFAELEAEAEKAPSGLTVTPYLLGACNPKWDPNATASITGITLGTTRAAVFRGILEGLARELAENTRILESLAGAFGEIRIFGGGTRSRLGLKLRAAATGKSLRVLHTSEAVCLGAALLAGKGAGVFADINEGVAQMVRFTSVVPPDA